jgi:hypothetical protein
MVFTPSQNVFRLKICNDIIIEKLITILKD